MIEVKTSDDHPSKNFNVFRERLLKVNPHLKSVQLVLNLRNEFSTKEGIEVRSLVPWLTNSLPTAF